MAKSRIISPMATGNGAYIIHRILGNKIPDYHICGYNPYWTLCPPALPFLCRRQGIPDIIHTTPDYAAFFKRRNVPLVVTFHNLILDSFMGRYSSLPQRIHYKTDLRFFTRKALAASAIVTSVSRSTADMVRKELGYSGDIRVIYNGIDTDMFYPAAAKQSPKIKVLFSGNLTKRKGADLLPYITKKLDDGIEILYTKGLRTKKLLPHSARLRDIGNVSFPEMPNIYQGADILLLPTVREGLSLAVLEAMACGLPVVATDCSSLPELIDNSKGGFLCPVGDVKAFAEKINLLADSPKLRHEMGEYNRSKIEKMFTLDRMVNEYQELFDEVLS